MREGFREVWRDPALLLIEIGWRWSFGVLSILVFTASLFLLLGSISLDSQRLESLTHLNPWQSAQMIAHWLSVVARQLLRIAISATLFLAFCWTCLSAVGRHATLTRPAFGYEPGLRSCLAISALRAALAMIAIVFWISASMVAGMVGATGRGEALPNPAMVLAVLVPTLVLLVSAGSCANWYLSLAPLFSAEPWQLSIASVWNFVRSDRDRIFEIAIISGVMRFVLFAAAFMVSLAIAAVVTNPRLLLADLIAVSLLYFLVADFIYVARLAAFGKLATGVRTQPTSVTARQPSNIDASSVRTSVQMPPVPSILDES